MDKLIEFIISEYGSPTAYSPLSTEELTALPSSLPAELSHLYREFGRFTLQSGRLQVCHPHDLKGVLSVALGGDRDFNEGNCHAFAYSAFGTVYFYQDIYGCGDLDLIEGQLHSARFTSNQEPQNPGNTVFLPFLMDDDSLDYYDTEDRPLFSRARRKLGALDIDECYGFVPAISLGGEPRLENLRKLKAREHFSILSQSQDIQLIGSSGYGESAAIRRIGA